MNIINLRKKRVYQSLNNYNTKKKSLVSVWIMRSRSDGSIGDPSHQVSV